MNTINSKISEKVLRKVLEAEDAEKLFERALEVKVCPKCASTLQRYVGEFDEVCADSNIKYKCTECYFTHDTYGLAKKGDLLM